MPNTQLAGKKIVVTGGAGFLGQQLCPKLRKAGAELFIPRRNEYDLTQLADVRRMYRDTNPQLVIHMAAEVGGIGANRENPGRFFYANMAMGLHLIEEGRKHGLEKFVQIGTICAYPKFTPVPFKEADLWNGYPEETNAPYGVAKKALLVMLQAYKQQYNFNGIYLLPVNLYGPGDNFDLSSSHVIPALIRKCIEAQRRNADEIVCWGTGMASREFLYVEDCAEGILQATQFYHDVEPVNLGSGREIAIADLIGLIAEYTGFKGRIVWDTTKPDGQPRRCLDVQKAELSFGFKAKVSLEEGLCRTVEWFRTQTDNLK